MDRKKMIVVTDASQRVISSGIKDMKTSSIIKNIKFDLSLPEINSESFVAYETLKIVQCVAALEYLIEERVNKND